VRRASQPTSQDVARAAGVSQATVSRVLNDGSVSDATRRRVLRAVGELGYTPNVLARGLVTRSTSLVGVVVSDITNVFYPELLEALAARLSLVRLKMLFINAASLDNAAAAQLLIEQNVDAAIFTATLQSSRAVLDLATHRFPVVLVNRELDAPVDHVVSDNVRGAALVAEHILGHGHRRIAVVAGHPEASTATQRTSGFLDALKVAPDIPAPTVVEGRFDYQQAYQGARHILASRPRPTAVFCHNDLMAFAVLNAARVEGVRVPENLSVVGFDDVRMASWEAFGLTTVRQPIQDMATTAVDLVHSRLSDPDHAPRKVVYPCELIVRNTSGPAPVSS
jgi:LacI family transcriptional regulator